MSARPLVATDRAALILQLVPFLIGRGEISVAEAADAFDVTPAQMRSMVEKLTVIGLPGERGFWQMSNDLFDIDWDLLDERDLIVITHTVGLERSPKLTAREAAALLAGLQLARTIPGFGDSALADGVLAKLARGASSVPAEVIVASGPVDAVRDAVASAVRRSVAVSFTYKAPDAAATTRTVDPAKVHIANGEWYLQGWCHMREAMRTFHLDRVSGLELTDTPITHGADPVPALFEPGPDDIVARIRFPEQVAPLLGDYLDRAEVATDRGIGASSAATGSAAPDTAAPDTAAPDTAVMSIATMKVADEHSLRRLAARRAGQVEILEPAAARLAAAEWARAGLALYE